MPARLTSAEGHGKTHLAASTADGVVNAANPQVVIDFAPSPARHGRAGP